MNDETWVRLQMARPNVKRRILREELTRLLDDARARGGAVCLTWSLTEDLLRALAEEEE